MRRFPSACLTALPWLSLLPLALPAPAEGRLRRLSEGLFLSDWRHRQVEFAGQGAQFAFDADTVRLESAAELRYGLLPRLGVAIAFPFISETRGDFAKAGQGDLLASLVYQQPLEAWPRWRIGLAETVSFPSGFREELAGFPAYTTRRSQSETLVNLELAESDDDPQPFWLNLHGGLRTDDHRENTVLIWGAALRYDLFRRWLWLESEFDQEMRTDDKSTATQFFIGGRGRLPFGFGLRVGAEQRFFGDLDRFGFYAGLSWRWAPTLPVEVRRRHLRAPLQRALDEKNRVPGFTLEPGTPELLQEAGRLAFLPLTVAVLPFEETDGHRLAARLEDRLRQTLEADSSLRILEPAQVQRVCRELKLDPAVAPSPEQVDELGRRLDADYVLYGRIQRHDPTLRAGLDWSPLLVRSRLGSRLEATAWLYDVQRAGPGSRAALVGEQYGEAHWVWLHAERGHGELADDPSERHRQVEAVLEDVSRQASDLLFYETSVQRIVE